MKSELSREFFAGNRRRLRELFTGTAPIVITANGKLQRSGDSTFPFQQDANFWYLTGLNEPDMILVIDKDKEYLIAPKLSEYQEVFDGQADTAAHTRRSGVTEILPYDAGWKRLGARVRRVKHVATLSAPPQYIDVYGMYTNPARWVLQRTLREYNDSLEILDIGKHLMKMRMIKQPEELAMIQRAIDITAVGLRQIMQPATTRQYQYEYEAEADLARQFRRAGSRHAFDPIVAGGARACTLHNTDMSGALSADELLLFDVGAEYEGYAADISRTIAIGQPSRRQQQVFDAVVEVQNYAYSILKPGVTMRDYEGQIEHFMGEKLRELGLIRSIDTEAVRKYYPHATSHHLGIQVHDVGDRSGELEENMVITVEPGIYIPEESIGIRIEDDVRITKAGVEILTSALPTKLV